MFRYFTKKPLQKKKKKTFNQLTQMARSFGHVSSVAVTVSMAVALCLFLAIDVTHARRPTTYYVGGKDGWDTVIPMDTWARGKTFYAGDILGTYR